MQWFLNLINLAKQELRASSNPWNASPRECATIFERSSSFYRDLKRSTLNIKGQRDACWHLVVSAWLTCFKRTFQGVLRNWEFSVKLNIENEFNCLFCLPRDTILLTLCESIHFFFYPKYFYFFRITCAFRNSREISPWK